MTKEELIKKFNAECTESDNNGNLAVKGTPADIANWIANKFCKPASTLTMPLFAKAFTGMSDKNGNPIHEGDHVRLYYKGEYVTCQVIYDTKHAAFFIKWPDGYINQYFMNGHNYEVIEPINIQK
jgi:hypothetical protein